MISGYKIKDSVKQLLSTRMSTSKELFYATNFLKYTIPQFLYKSRLSKLLDEKNIKNLDYVKYRVDYCNKLDAPFKLNNATSIKNFKFRHAFSTYFFDTYELTKYFNKNYVFNYEFGDVVTIPEEPSFVKSRPIHGDNKNSILLKLNKIRHYGFVKDKIDFSDKKNIVLWRGNVTDNKVKRIAFFKAHFDNELCDIGVTSRKFREKKWFKEKMTLGEQLKYKFILSLEGHDVATNLKWVMSSNSIAVMPTPEYETWFMEGTLIPDYHYIHIKKDYSDLDEKLNFYLNNPEKAAEIIKNANAYVDNFKDKKQERLISLLILKKYFDLNK
ncbi:glycosyl transferase family 90 [Saccharicrinis fermentans]|uniref:Glycosyl transferase CAP10 domain-containing protein n=1 Tax=Saccharicrinis fermentans DSM 9555 = JCM 21142 TaxID=869213 RepID=W7YGS2_9BACT|nr:glycosyl transferase family 90 [Saccharicrinis fermentans]GAF01814.1 hypothetical protein JCM21142_431 [Saccharicrinis fermentans DSM 9555 = JCM 21142]